MNPMMEALKQRRGKSFTIEIQVTPEEGKSTDLAPPKEKEELPQELQDGEEMPTGELDEAEGMADMDGEMLDSMSDFEKNRLQGAQPKSLGERAKQAALLRKK